MVFGPAKQVDPSIFDAPRGNANEWRPAPAVSHALKGSRFQINEVGCIFFIDQLPPEILSKLAWISAVRRWIFGRCLRSNARQQGIRCFRIHCDHPARWGNGVEMTVNNGLVSVRQIRVQNAFVKEVKALLAELP